MPKLSNLSSKDLLEFCHQNNIGLIIPIRDGELEYFAMLKEELKAGGVDVMVSELKSITNSLDKLAFASLENIKAIPAFKNIDHIMEEAFVVKERYGAGAKSIGINLNKSEALNHARNLEHPIFQPFVKGNEISVDAYITREGKIKGIIMRKRDLVVHGESQVTSTFFDGNLEIIFKDILASLQLYGHVILQAIIDEKKGYMLLNATHGSVVPPRFHCKQVWTRFIGPIWSRRRFLWKIILSLERKIKLLKLDILKIFIYDFGF